ncbi:MAG: TatD family hydrolase [Candidatus Omnitrophota bacterium]|nr:TatD family hydrolase [Candidatus Omnitrophota bacterium]
MLIDTHCHLDFEDFDKDRDDVIKRADNQGIKYIINVGSTVEGSGRSLELAKKYDKIFSSIGVHPHYAHTLKKNTLSEMRRLAKEKKVVAIGEVGLDYYKNNLPKDVQKSAFRKFIKLSRDVKLPLIVHNREAHRDTLAILREELGREAKGVMHCFSGDINFLDKCLDMGLFVSFTCNLTFKNAGKIRELAARVPLERLLLETDAPFLAPQIFRGKRNEPSYLIYLIKELAGVKGVMPWEIEEATTQNAIRLFFDKKKLYSGFTQIES